ncbi:type II toxin-antitoxin system HicB family antitoxin [Methylobacterium sp. GC_Met_2]|uniref:type II toxin-antitoxin system HicB family antitoxin n=1 Tax=Methylobacterium sp. GC_Met_2 TaxID=2937376 RepID=UPI00226B9DFA|nr:type II toxin-antitoxin system HicB family antitoxin [Methylobacterium sp. GC_Met_2]
MSNVLRYKGYAARVEFDADDHVFVGTIAGISDGVGFHADTVTALEAAFREAVEDYVETCAKVGKAPQRPYSGSLQFRVSPELHANVARAAELSGKSLNQWGEEVLRRAADADAP